MQRLTTLLICATCREAITHAADVLVDNHGAVHLKCRSRHLRNVTRELFSFGHAAGEGGGPAWLRKARQRRMRAAPARVCRALHTPRVVGFSPESLVSVLRQFPPMQPPRNDDAAPARLSEDVCLSCNGRIEWAWQTTRVFGFTIHNECLDAELGMRRRGRVTDKPRNDKKGRAA